MKRVFWTVVAVGFLSSLSPAFAGTACKPSFYHGSNAALLTGGRITSAKENAIVSWTARVTTSIGPLYGDWAKARGKTFRCVKRNGRHKCTARARPCRDS
jgi:hypothetical protein